MRIFFFNKQFAKIEVCTKVKGKELCIKVRTDAIKVLPSLIHAHWHDPIIWTNALHIFPIPHIFLAFNVTLPLLFERTFTVLESLQGIIAGKKQARKEREQRKMREGERAERPKARNISNSISLLSLLSLCSIGRRQASFCSLSLSISLSLSLALWMDLSPRLYCGHRSGRAFLSLLSLSLSCSHNHIGVSPPATEEQQPLVRRVSLRSVPCTHAHALRFRVLVLFFSFAERGYLTSTYLLSSFCHWRKKEFL